jgi:hypothetical protein
MSNNAMDEQYGGRPYPDRFEIDALREDVERLRAELAAQSKMSSEWIDAQAAELAQLRETLANLLVCSAYRETGSCGQCEQAARAALMPRLLDGE